LAFVKLDCVTCVLTVPFLGKLARAYGDEVPFLIVAEEGAQAAREIARLGKLPEEIIALESEPYQTSAGYGLYAVPTVFVLSPTREVLDILIGWNRAKYEALNKRLAEAARRAPIALVTDTDGVVPASKPGCGSKNED
jgi:thiol-disulfide isomerase/thioredoxin